MPSLINTPAPVVATAVTTSAATELVIVTSSPCNLLVPEALILIQFEVDFLNSASGATITFKIRRGTTTGGTLVTVANTWGPFTLAASTRYNFGMSAYDQPGEAGGIQYTVTGTIASNAATSTYETAIISTQVQQGS
jgi:hypothetical protein